MNASAATRSCGVLLALGDSHTACESGGDWMAVVRKDLAARNVSVIQKGYNGITSNALHDKLSPILKEHCQGLMAATLLVGTNDLLAQHSSSWTCLHRHVMRQIEAKPTRDSWLSNVKGMLRLLAEQAPTCKVAVITLPPLGEDLDHSLNKTVAAWNEGLRQLVAQEGNAQLVDLWAASQAHLEKSGGNVPFPARLSKNWLWALWYITPVSLQHSILGRPWDTLGASSGLRLLCDFVHFNDTGAALLVQQLHPFLEQL